MFSLINARDTLPPPPQLLTNKSTLVRVICQYALQIMNLDFSTPPDLLDVGELEKEFNLFSSGKKECQIVFYSWEIGNESWILKITFCNFLAAMSQ